jgi:hypothetical protein
MLVPPCTVHCRVDSKPKPHGVLLFAGCYRGCQCPHHSGGRHDTAGEGHSCTARCDIRMTTRFKSNAFSVTRLSYIIRVGTHWQMSRACNDHVVIVVRQKPEVLHRQVQQQVAAVAAVGGRVSVLAPLFLDQPRLGSGQRLATLTSVSIWCG